MYSITDKPWLYHFIFGRCEKKSLKTKVEEDIVSKPVKLIKVILKMKTLADLLTSQSLKPYFDKAQYLTQLNKIFSIEMQEWAEHCQIANFEAGRLNLQVGNAAWATRIRYAIPEIIKTLSSYTEFASLKIIKISLDMTKHPKTQGYPR